MNKDYDLIQVANKLGATVEDLIRYAAHEELTIFVIAEDWPARSTNGLVDEVLDGPVTLIPEDLQRSMNADCTVVRQIKIAGTNALVTLDPPVEVRRGVHFVTAGEFQQFKVKHATTCLEQHADSPPYLNRHHKNFSPELDAAVRAWLALFADGTFERGNRGVLRPIKTWLRGNAKNLKGAAIKRIATVVNPERLKTGGAPPTD